MKLVKYKPINSVVESEPVETVTAAEPDVYPMKLLYFLKLLAAPTESFGKVAVLVQFGDRCLCRV